MKKCAFLLSLAGLLCLLTPATAHAGAPQWRQAHRARAARETLRKSPKAPRHDQVHRGDLDGTITLIQLMSTRRGHEDRHNDRVTPPDSAAQVRASRDDAERISPAALIARAVDSLPPHWGATHLCV